jgi:hypothetical protein
VNFSYLKELVDGECQPIPTEDTTDEGDENGGGDTDTGGDGGDSGGDGGGGDEGADTTDEGGG